MVTGGWVVRNIFFSTPMRELHFGVMRAKKPFWRHGFTMGLHFAAVARESRAKKLKG